VELALYEYVPELPTLNPLEWRSVIVPAEQAIFLKKHPVSTACPVTDIF
jgi:hypothetical protein